MWNYPNVKSFKECVDEFVKHILPHTSTEVKTGDGWKSIVIREEFQIESYLFNFTNEYILYSLLEKRESKKGNTYWIQSEKMRISNGMKYIYKIRKYGLLPEYMYKTKHCLVSPSLARLTATERKSIIKSHVGGRGYHDTRHINGAYVYNLLKRLDAKRRKIAFEYCKIHGIRSLAEVLTLGYCKTYKDHGYYFAESIYDDVLKTKSISLGKNINNLLRYNIVAKTVNLRNRPYFYSGYCSFTDRTNGHLFIVKI